MRRLQDLPGVDALELKALMKPRFADPDMPEGREEIDAVSKAVFGLGLDEAEATALPADWDGIETLRGGDLVEAFEAEGWDVADRKRKVLRVAPILALPLALALRGVAGELPFEAEPAEAKDDWAAGMAAEAARFRKR